MQANRANEKELGLRTEKELEELKAQYRKELLYSPKNVSETEEGFFEKAKEFCEGYKAFIDSAKTEREAASFAAARAEEKGFKPYDRNRKLSAGEGVYLLNRGKAIVLIKKGTLPISEGANLVIAHTDSPRLDLKQRPLYEEGGMAYFKTHYYGGIKKYHWTALPLALHGVLFKKNGEKVEISVGEKEGEPVFCISDLMPHIAKDQVEKPLASAITGEGLNIIVGSVPLEDGTEVKLALLKLLNEKYGITEEDFLRAELSAVPAGKSKDVGFDGGMIGAYGHDDRVCAYPSMEALFDSETPERTAICIFADKEEIGSEGVTGLLSAAYTNLFKELCEAEGAAYGEFCENSCCLSADVGGAFDPCYGEAYDGKNSAYVNKGVVVTKYTGARGKSGSSDASAELVAKITSILDSRNVAWQTGEYGKVDQGGAGTVAKVVASWNVDVVDLGVPILSMHAPFELASKGDIYMMYKAAKAFFELR